MSRMDKKEIMAILTKIADVGRDSPGSERICSVCRKKLWVCDSQGKKSECVGRMARKLLERMGK